MACRDTILQFLASELAIAEFSADAALNGVQIEGSSSVHRLGVAVDAGESVLEQAISRKVDMLLVHHGIFWGKPQAIRGSHKSVIALALQHNLTLVGLHLPLDAHPRFGNNALLAHYLQLPVVAPAALYDGKFIGVVCSNPSNRRLNELCQDLATLEGAIDSFLTLPFGPEIPQRICIVSGSACDQLYNFEKEKFDTLITGEPRQFAYHFCRSEKLNACFPGHYATETLGIRALGELVAKQFSLELEVISEPTGI